MSRLSLFTATGLLLIGLSATISAEELAMPVPEAEAETPVTESKPATEYSVQLPGRGMTMEMVQKRFGQALEAYPAVGEPPITKWVYKDFTVYFESEYVIHAVANF